MKRHWIGSVLLLFLAGCGSKTSEEIPIAVEFPDGIRFTDITAESGIDFTCRNGMEAKAFTIAETLGGGAGVLDYDQDGKDDFLLIGGGTIDPLPTLEGRGAGLFRNLDGKRFQEITGPARVEPPPHYSHAATVGDFNSDGFEDVLVTGYGGLVLFQNQGDGTFVEVSQQVALTDDLWSTGAGWGDVNADGLLDLYVTHYLDWSWDNDPECFSGDGQREVCGPEKFAGLKDTLYLANVDGTFRNATAEAGLVGGGKGLGVVMMDFDGDADLDIYVANDTDDNFLYLNDGTGKFIERGAMSGTAHDERGYANGSMGVSVLDYNSDTLPDLWVANFESDSFALYRNEGNAAFTHVSGSAGIFAIGSSYVGWGTITDDMDGDGDEDIIVSNGHVLYAPRNGQTRQLPLVLQYQQQDQRFERISFPSDHYLGQVHHGRGLVKSDIDNDGDWDLGFADLNEPFALLRNDAERSSRWIGLRLVGVESNRQAIGAKVVLRTDDDAQARFVSSGGSYLSHSSLRLLWSVPAGISAARIEIQWPSGRLQEVVVDQWDRHLTILELDEP